MMFLCFLSVVYIANFEHIQHKFQEIKLTSLLVTQALQKPNYFVKIPFLECQIPRKFFFDKIRFFKLKFSFIREAHRQI